MARVALLDACVLYSAPLRDLLVRLASAGVIRGRWSTPILDECFRSLLDKRPDLAAAALERTRKLMIDAVPDCMVTGFEGLIPRLDLPDPGDRHVLAAAICGGADAIVTLNLADFPRAALAPYGIDALHPDELLVELLETSAGPVAQVVTEQAVALKRPQRTVRDLLDIFKAQGLVRAVPKLAEVLEVSPPAERAQRDRPLISLSEIESRAAWDEIKRPLDEGILEEARADVRHSRELAVSIAMLTRRDGAQRFAGAISEYGDDEGRRLVGGLVRAFRARWLEPRERLVRVLLRANIDDDVYSITHDPLRASSVERTAEEVVGKRKKVPWELDVARADSDFNGREVRVSVAILTRVDGLRRFTLSEVELGEGEARREVGAFVRKVRRTRLLRDGESLERFTFCARLGSLRYELIPDPTDTTRVLKRWST